MDTETKPKVLRYLPNGAPVKCKQIEFIDSPESWWISKDHDTPGYHGGMRISAPDLVKIEHTIGESTTIYSAVVCVTTASKGRIIFEDLLTTGKGKPLWFLLAVSVARWKDAGHAPQKGEQPRRKIVWLVTDNENWYRINDPKLQRAKSGRAFCPCNFSLTLEAKVILQKILEQYVRAERV